MKGNTLIEIWIPNFCYFITFMTEFSHKLRKKTTIKWSHPNCCQTIIKGFSNSDLIKWTKHKQKFEVLSIMIVAINMNNDTPSKGSDDTIKWRPMKCMSHTHAFCVKSDLTQRSLVLIACQFVRLQLLCINQFNRYRVFSNPANLFNEQT